MIISKLLGHSEIIQTRKAVKSILSSILPTVLKKSIPEISKKSQPCGGELLSTCSSKQAPGPGHPLKLPGNVFLPILSISVAI